MSRAVLPRIFILGYTAANERPAARAQVAGQIKCCPDNGPETRVHTRITSRRYRSTSDLNNAPWVSSAPGNNQSVRNRTPRFDQARVLALPERKKERGGMRAQVRSDWRLAMVLTCKRSYFGRFISVVHGASVSKWFKGAFRLAIRKHRRNARVWRRIWRRIPNVSLFVNLI